MATILYIEDDQSLRQLVRLLISRRDNMTLLEAETGEEGIELARQHLPDTVLIDISLPDIQGGDVLKRLREDETTRHIPAIAISGNGIEETRTTSPDFDAYLAKPVNIQALYAAIDLVLS